MLCYAVLCCAMLCYAVLCWALFVAIISYLVLLCYAVLCCAMLGSICGDHILPCLAVLCCAMLCYAVLCCALLCFAFVSGLVITRCVIHCRVYEGYPYLLAEMYAYSMAAAHEELPHLQLENYMVSNVDAGGEGWPHIDRLQSVCVPPSSSGIFYPGELMPTVLHYCQTYRAGDISFMKRRVPHDIFTCESPMLVDTPPDLANKDYIMKEGKVGGCILTLCLYFFRRGTGQLNGIRFNLSQKTVFFTVILDIFFWV